MVTALREWGDTWIAGKGNEPAQTVHKGCGARITTRHVCSECGEPLRLEDLGVAPGPGLRDPDILPPSALAPVA